MTNDNFLVLSLLCYRWSSFRSHGCYLHMVFSLFFVDYLLSFFFQVVSTPFLFCLVLLIVGSHPCFFFFYIQVFFLWYPRPMSLYTLGLHLGTHPMLFWTFKPNMIKQHKQLPFLFMCVFWGISLNFICSHVPMEIFIFYEMKKKGGNKKRVVLHKGRFLYSCVLLKFGNTFDLMPSSAPPLGECTLIGTSPIIQTQWNHVICH